MRILIGCEYSGAVGDLFHEQGHQVTICDIIPYEGKYPHIFHQGDVVPLLREKWDLIIAFPPCTHLAVSGALHFAEKIKDGRQQAGVDFFMLFANNPAPMIAIENPVGIMSKRWRKPDQIIQPYDFGEDASKKTCLWLKGLPLLKPTKHIPGIWACPQCRVKWESSMISKPCSCPSKPKMIWGNQTPSAQNKLGPSDERAKERSKTYMGIAHAMVDQWGSLKIPKKLFEKKML